MKTEDDTYWALRKLTPDQYFDAYVKRFPAGRLVNEAREDYLQDYYKFLKEVGWTQEEHTRVWREKYGNSRT